MIGMLRVSVFDFRKACLMAVLAEATWTALLSYMFPNPWPKALLSHILQLRLYISRKHLSTAQLSASAIILCHLYRYHQQSYLAGLDRNLMIGYIWTRLQIAVIEMGISLLTKQLPVIRGQVSVECALLPGTSTRCSGEALSPWITFH